MGVYQIKTCQVCRADHFMHIRQKTCNPCKDAIEYDKIRLLYCKNCNASIVTHKNNKKYCNNKCRKEYEHNQYLRSKYENNY